MKKKSSNPTVACLSGAIAGGIESIAIWPTEYTKTLLQLQKNGSEKEYTGMIDCAKKQIKKNGIFGLYKGLSTALIFSIPKASIRFGSYSYYNNIINNKYQPSPFNSLFAGMLSGCTEAILIVTPQETIKTKLIENNESFKKGVSNIIKKNGVSGLYNGLIPTIIKQSTNQGIRFMSYNIYKNNIINIDPNKNITTTQALLGGMFSGTISTICNNPIDMIKTRLQGFDSYKYNGTIDCIKKVIKNEGLLSLYKGLDARLMRVIPGQGIIFASYERISNFLENKINKY
jgi:solute carrier family 25 (mitochondrial citrate transporter), member 1